jgi:hypothetical protein
MLWLGRVIILLALLVQYCGTMWLYVRRVHTGYRVWSVDTRNFEMVLGGFVVIVCSLSISLLNTDWEARGQFPPDSYQLEDRPGQGSNENGLEQSNMITGRGRWQANVLDDESLTRPTTVDQAHTAGRNPNCHS